MGLETCNDGGMQYNQNTRWRIDYDGIDRLCADPEALEQTCYELGLDADMLRSMARSSRRLA